MPRRTGWSSRVDPPRSAGLTNWKFHPEQRRHCCRKFGKLPKLSIFLYKGSDFIFDACLWTLKQCCGSGSEGSASLGRIRIHNTVVSMDPDPDLNLAQFHHPSPPSHLIFSHLTFLTHLPHPPPWPLLHYPKCVFSLVKQIRIRIHIGLISGIRIRIKTSGSATLLWSKGYWRYLRFF